jgi:hypothetical protein
MNLREEVLRGIYGFGFEKVCLQFLFVMFLWRFRNF